MELQAAARIVIASTTQKERGASFSGQKIDNMHSETDKARIKGQSWDISLETGVIAWLVCGLAGA